jgi:hypothetical protein
MDSYVCGEKLVAEFSIILLSVVLFKRYAFIVSSASSEFLVRTHGPLYFGFEINPGLFIFDAGPVFRKLTDYQTTR